MALLANAVGVPARVSLDGTVRARRRRLRQGRARRRRARHGRVRLGDAARQPVHRDQEPAAAAAEDHAAARAGQGRTATAQRRTAGRGGQLEQRRLPGGDRAARRRVRASPRSWSPCSPTRGRRCSPSRRRRPRSSCSSWRAAAGGAPAARPSARVAGAWRELVDLGRDLGIAGAGGPPADPPGVGRARRGARPADGRRRGGGGRRRRVRPGRAGRRGCRRGLAAGRGGPARGDREPAAAPPGLGGGESREPVGLTCTDDRVLIATYRVFGLPCTP